MRLAYFEAKGILADKSNLSADDVVADSYRKLLTVIGRYSPERGGLSSFVLAVVRGVALDHRRWARRRPTVPAEGENAPPEPSVGAGESMMETAAASLRRQLTAPEDPEERFVFDRVMEGFRRNEIVKTYGISEKVVRRVHKKTLERAKVILDRLLAE
jgi:RNA polymerase sigma factor (sigma-70 family)